jgi:predicted transcriptional regulator
MQMKNPRLKGGFGMVSRAVMTDPELCIRDKALYAYLTAYADSVANELTVSVNRMAAECGVTQSTIKRSLKNLEDKGIIRRMSTGALSTRKTILLK